MRRACLSCCVFPHLPLSPQFHALSSRLAADMSAVSASAVSANASMLALCELRDQRLQSTLLSSSGDACRAAVSRAVDTIVAVYCQRSRRVTAVATMTDVVDGDDIDASMLHDVRTAVVDVLKARVVDDAKRQLWHPHSEVTVAGVDTSGAMRLADSRIARITAAVHDGIDAVFGLFKDSLLAAVQQGRRGLVDAAKHVRTLLAG